jgi:glycolate dehydrogenase iron-sulfur subunit
MQTHFDPIQLRDPDTAASEQILRKCVHCGFCTATCPTYVLLGDELDGPRGRIYLIKDMLESGRPAAGQVVQHLDRCLSCLACMTACPSGVNYQHLIDHARAHIERTYRRPWSERALRSLLARIVPYPRRLRAAIAAAGIARGLTRLLPDPTPATAAARAAPWRSLLRLASYRAPSRGAPEHRPSERAASGTGRPRVALLTGCAQSVLTPRTEAACRRLLERAGVEVVVVEGCCGALVHHLGRVDQNRDLAAALLDKLEAAGLRDGLDAVVVTASGCGTHLKDYAYLFRNDAQLAPAAAAAAASARDITEWLDERGREAGGSSRPASALEDRGTPPSERPGAGLVVAYHSACSMQHGQRLGRTAQRLLERAGFVVEEIPEGHLCCGSAGTYNILQPRLAAQLRDRKLLNIRRTRARVVATGNVGCMVQLAGAGDLQVVHTAELLDWAQGGPAPVTADARSGSSRDRR